MKSTYYVRIEIILELKHIIHIIFIFVVVGSACVCFRSIYTKFEITRRELMNTQHQ